MCLLATTFGCFFDHQHAVSVLRGECKHRLIFILDTPAVLPYFLPIRGKDGTGGYLSISFQYGILGMAAGGVLTAYVCMDFFLLFFTLIFMVIATLNFYNMEAA